MIHDLILTVRRVSCMVDDVFVLLTSRLVYFGTHFSIRTIMVITWFIITSEIHSSNYEGRGARSGLNYDHSACLGYLGPTLKRRKIIPG
jgi:hypothetical protein